MRINSERILGWFDTVRYRIKMRENPTSAESVLWGKLKGKKLNRLRFRRQHGIGPFIADFYHSQTKTIIELDGGIHSKSEIKINDKEREEYLKECGYNIIRFSNNEVFNNLNNLLKKIITHIIPPLGG